MSHPCECLNIIMSCHWVHAQPIKLNMGRNKLPISNTFSVIIHLKISWLAQKNTTNIRKRWFWKYGSVLTMHEFNYFIDRKVDFLYNRSICAAETMICVSHLLAARHGPDPSDIKLWRNGGLGLVTGKLLGKFFSPPQLTQRKRHKKYYNFMLFHFFKVLYRNLFLLFSFFTQPNY